MRRDRLARRRKDVGLSQEGLAERLGVDRSTVVRWERGETSPQPWHRPRLADALSVSTETLASLLADFDERPAGRPPRLDHRLGASEDSSRRPDIEEGDDPDKGGDVLRRDVLTQSLGFVASVATGPLVRVLLRPERGEADAPWLPSHVLASAVAEAKTAYQATRYAVALERLVMLLPAADAARHEADGESSSRIHRLAADAYHVASSVLLKCGDHPMALVAAERCWQCAGDSGDPVAVGTSARIMVHALMAVGHSDRAVDFAQEAAKRAEPTTTLANTESVSVYGALLLRGAIAAARTERRDTAEMLLTEASRAAHKLGRDGNDRWTGFGPTNVLQHRVTVALALGDAGTAIDYARQVPLAKVRLVERRASLFIDVAQAYAQWGRREQALSALQTAYGVAPEEIRSRPVAHRMVQDLAALSHGHLRTQIGDFAALAGVPL